MRRCEVRVLIGSTEVKTSLNLVKMSLTFCYSVLFGNFAFSDFSEIKNHIYRKIPKLPLVITFVYEL